jgi:hypothetical protein
MVQNIIVSLVAGILLRLLFKDNDAEQPSKNPVATEQYYKLYVASDGTHCPEELLKNAQYLQKCLETLQAHFRKNVDATATIVLTSGYRSDKTNDNAEGTKGSWHKKAGAGDFYVQGHHANGVTYPWPHNITQYRTEEAINKKVIPVGELGKYSHHTHYAPTGTLYVFNGGKSH